MIRTNMHRRGGHGGFTLIELLVVVAIIALLISILLPSLARARELSRRTACAANLRAIAMSALVYAEANAGKLPASFHNVTDSGFSAFTSMVGRFRMWPDGWTDAANAQPWAGDGSVPRSYFKLLMGGQRSYLQRKQWVCPSTRSLGHRPEGPNPEELATSGYLKTYDFDGITNTGAAGGQGTEIVTFSYSMQVNTRLMGTPQGGGTTKTSQLMGILLTNTQDPRKALAADRNPYSNCVKVQSDPGAQPATTQPRYMGQVYYTAYAKGSFENTLGLPNPPTTGDKRFSGNFAVDIGRREANSRNHNQDGQNVSYLDGHCSWAKTSKAGADEDFIWGPQDSTQDPTKLTQALELAAGPNATGKVRSDPALMTDSMLFP